MPQTVGSQKVKDTPLARARLRRDVSQAQMAKALGISENTYRRLERYEHRTPPLRYLTNAAILLEWPLEELIEPYREWWPAYPGHRPTRWSLYWGPSVSP